MESMGRKTTNDQDGTELEALTGVPTQEADNDAANRQAPSLLAAVKWPQLGIAFCFFIAILVLAQDLELLGVPIPAAKRCLAMLVCISTLWATEAIPLYATSLLVPLLTIMTGSLLPESEVVCDVKDFVCRRKMLESQVPYAPAEAAKVICGQFFDPTVLLFMAGFSIGAVLEKQRLSNMIASLVLRPFGNKPEFLLLGIMFLGAFLSMWISNVPSSVLCVSLAQPIINQLSPRDPFAKSLLLGIAISNNIGGMTSPIASPQNVIAFNWCSEAGAPISFLGWLTVSLPFCSLLLLMAWSVLRWRYPPLLRVLQIADLTREHPKMNATQIVALGVTSATVLAWAMWKPLRLEPLFGSMGVVGLVPIVTFCSLGLLDRNDFHHALNWSTLILIGGGLALGHVMERSYLLNILSSGVESSLSGAGLWTYMTAFSLLMAIIANFVSSTVAAIIILPVVANVGKSIEHPAAIIIASVLMDSAAMALPVSSFPNANSFAVTRKAAPPEPEQEAGDKGGGKPAGQTNILEVQDYIITGGMVTVLAQIETCTVGYLLLRMLEG